MSDTRRIFISSTAEDLKEYRQQIYNAILRLDYMPVGMENFGAKSEPPVELCKEKVRSCNAIVVVVAHRYGWVPPIEKGGDGEKSITWIEVITALENKIPVLVFLVNETFKWSEAKEQDQLTKTTDPVQIAQIVANVQSLQEFKSFLNNDANINRDTFTTPQDLEAKVSTAIANLFRKEGTVETKPKKEVPLRFDEVHPLQPAPHFKGRKQLLKDLISWWEQPVSPDRVQALIAIGGTGKTAIAEQFVRNIKNERLKGSVLVWSFYASPSTDEFLKEACIVFTGEAPEGEGGKLERLQRALSNNKNQNLLVLDGLELVQAEGKSGSDKTKGDLQDHRLKILLRSIAAGNSGNTRALITSRFNLTDLTSWENAGYKGHNLEMLDPDSAIALLRAWKVQGKEDELAKIALQVGNHALSVSVLGSYLNHYCNGNPDEIKDFNLNDITPDEPLASRLARVLGGYAKNLPDAERDLLIRLSMFPNGVTVDIIGYLIGAGGEVAGALIGLNQKRVAIIAERLRELGLIYSYNRNNAITYTSHPFLRDYFRNLLGLKSAQIHEVIMNKIADGLDRKPENKPIESIILDKYEQLIEQSILAGYYQEAFDIYWNTMAGSNGQHHVYNMLDDYGRLIRITKLFASNGLPQTITNALNAARRSHLICYWGLAAGALGDLQMAETCSTLGCEIDKQLKEWQNYSIQLRNFTEVNCKKGLLPIAKTTSLEAIKYLDKAKTDKENFKFDYVVCISNDAYVYYLLGAYELASSYFEKATLIEGQPLTSICGWHEVDYLITTGDKEKAWKRINENLEISKKHLWYKEECIFSYWLGIFSLSDQFTKSRDCLEEMRRWTEKSGNMECIIQSHILASEIAYCTADFEEALREASTGHNHAEGCGYGIYAIDLLLLQSKIYIAKGDYKAALASARQALDRSLNPECGYAWGQANGAHLCGVSHKNMNEKELAIQRLERALTIRERIKHPEVEETRKLLAELKA